MSTVTAALARSQVAWAMAPALTPEATSAAADGLDAAWRTRFEQLLARLQLTPAEQAQLLAQLASTSMTEAQLQATYDQLAASLPAWNDAWEARFAALHLPEDLLRQLRSSGAAAHALEGQYRQLLDARSRFEQDGRLARLREAGASTKEQWSIMLAGLDGARLDAAIEQIVSGHVSGARRFASIGINLMPGMFAAQYLSGRDWVTGEHIDRTNPLNLIGSVVSGVAAITAVRGAMRGIRGLAAADRAAAATMRLADGTATSLAAAAASLRARGVPVPLAQGPLDAIEAAGLASRFARGLRATDYIKASVPIVNRIGDAGRLAAVGRGYEQGMQLAAGAAALTRLTDAAVRVDPLVRMRVLGALEQGAPIVEAVAAASRGPDAVLSAAQVVRGYEAVGFLQGSVSRAVDGSRLLRGNGVFAINPLRTTHTIATTNRTDVLSLGRGMNFASRGGLAQGLAALDGVLIAGPAGFTPQVLDASNPLMRGATAARLSGLSIANERQRLVTFNQTAYWTHQLGIDQPVGLRSMLERASADSRSARNVTDIVEQGGRARYRATRRTLSTLQWLGSSVTTPIVAASVVGLSGHQLQPGWEYLQQREPLLQDRLASQASARDEAFRVAQPYLTAHSGGAAVTPQRLDLDQTTGLFIDQVTGIMVDPSRGAIYDRDGHLIDISTTNRERTP